VGGWTLQVAEAVCARADIGAEHVFEGMTSLVDKSLLQRLEHTGEDSKEPSLRMLETIREYGQEALTAQGEGASACQAHADYFCRVAEEAESALQGPQLVPWLEQLEREHDNLRAALRWACESARPWQALRLATALERFWVIRGYTYCMSRRNFFGGMQLRV
jgi:predicted ATPase